MNRRIGHLATDTVDTSTKRAKRQNAGNDTCGKVCPLARFRCCGLNGCLCANIVHHQRVMIPWIHQDNVIRIRNECNSLDANLHQYE